jgi:carbonic anhydrase
MSSAKRVSRREFVRATGLTAGLVAGAGTTAPARAHAAGQADRNRDADAVLAKLLEGNRRFVKGEPAQPRRKPEDFAALAEGQAPLAVVVGCADSRVSPELLFDVGIGDLFVVRVAGNVISGAGATVKGSIEYAVAELGVRLILVLGHSKCGAVKAAVKHIDDRDALPGSIGDLVDTIRPACAAAENTPGDKLDNVIRANVGRGVERLKGLKPVLADRVKEGRVKVVGAVYELKSGEVKVVG